MAQQLGAIRAQRITDDGNLELEFWEGQPEGEYDIMWFPTHVTKVILVASSVVTEIFPPAPPEEPEG